MTAQPTLTAALADLDERFARQTAAFAAQSPAERSAAFIAHHRRAAMGLIKKARAHRQWLRRLDVTNPGARQFYPERLDLVMSSVRLHRRYVCEGRARLAAPPMAAEV